jgi:hypothetical protein
MRPAPFPCVKDLLKTRKTMRSSDRSSETSVNLDVTSRIDYFGVEVELIVALPHCSGIRYQDREFVVLTEDLWRLKTNNGPLDFR